MRKRIEVYADWQPGSMGDDVPTERCYFNTIDQARSKIDEFRKTACTVRVSEIELLEEYVWGKRKVKKE